MIANCKRLLVVGSAVKIGLFSILLIPLFNSTSTAQTNEVKHLTLDQAIELALHQNHDIHLETLNVNEMKSKKDEARSDYLPKIKASGSVLHITEIAGVHIPAGAFGSYPAIGTVPSQSLFIDQGGQTGYTGSAALEQPLTQLFRIHEANVAAKQDVSLAQNHLDQTRDDIALKTRQLYYGILVSEKNLEASRDTIAAAQIKDAESRRDVERGNALDIATYQSLASLLDAQQKMLTFRLQGEDLRRQLNDLLGLPLEAKLELDDDPAGRTVEIPSRADAIRMAMDQNQGLRAARMNLDKAKAELAAARDNYIPDVTALSLYSYQSGIPFLVHNFGTFGFKLSYDLFDGGRREEQVRGAKITMASAETVIAKLQSEISVQVQAAYDRVEQLKQLEEVVQQMVKTRSEAARLSDRQFEQNAALASLRSQAHADLSTANASLLETDLQLTLAEADLVRTIGRMPR